MKTLMLTFLSSWMVMSAWIPANSVSIVLAMEQSDKVVAEPGSKENRNFALDLLKKQAETQIRLKSFKYVESVSLEIQTQMSQEPYAKLNGNTLMKRQNEFRTDGNRASVRLLTWGNVKSATDFIPEDRCPYNSLLWDGKTFFEYVATMDKNSQNRISIETRQNKSQYRQRFAQLLTPLWSRTIVGEISDKAVNLSVKTNREQVGQAQCYVIDARTSDWNYTVWIDPEQQYNIVKTTMFGKKDSLSCSLERVVCKNIDGIWIPVEGYCKRDQSFPNSEYAKEVRHHKITEITLNPDHETLHSFVPDDVKNGTRVRIDLVNGQMFNSRELPLWQDGRVVDLQGHTLFDSELKKP